MKNRVLVAIVAIFLFGATSCAYKTCPTYSKAKSATSKATQKA
jgi:hypothetical protein